MKEKEKEKELFLLRKCRRAGDACSVYQQFLRVVIRDDLRAVGEGGALHAIRQQGPGGQLLLLQVAELFETEIVFRLDFRDAQVIEHRHDSWHGQPFIARDIGEEHGIAHAAPAQVGVFAGDQPVQRQLPDRDALIEQRGDRPFRLADGELPLRSSGTEAIGDQRTIEEAHFSLHPAEEAFGRFQIAVDAPRVIAARPMVFVVIVDIQRVANAVQVIHPRAAEFFQVAHVPFDAFLRQRQSPVRTFHAAAPESDDFRLAPHIGDDIFRVEVRGVEEG